MKFHEKDILKFFFSQIFHHNLKETSHLTWEIVLEKIEFMTIGTFYSIYLVIMKIFWSIFKWIKGVPLYEKSTFSHNLNVFMSIPTKFWNRKNQSFWGKNKMIFERQNLILDVLFDWLFGILIIVVRKNKSMF